MRIKNDCRNQPNMIEIVNHDCQAKPGVKLEPSNENCQAQTRVGLKQGKVESFNDVYVKLRPIAKPSLGSK